jgi:hypothetical protein
MEEAARRFLNDPAVGKIVAAAVAVIAVLTISHFLQPTAIARQEPVPRCKPMPSSSAAEFGAELP